MYTNGGDVILEEEREEAMGRIHANSELENCEMRMTMSISLYYYNFLTTQRTNEWNGKWKEENKVELNAERRAHCVNNNCGAILLSYNYLEQ